MELKFRENGEFSILAIADAQDTDNPQKETTDIIRYSIEKTSPDLIILLGDNIAGYFEGVTPKRTKAAVKALLEPISEKDIPFALLASLVLGVVSIDSLLDNGAPDILSRTDGLVLLGYFSVFMAYTYFISRNKEAGADMQQPEKPQQLMPYWKISLYIIIGLAGLVIGGNLFVDGASKIAIAMGVSETIVGLTLVAAGTSLPELATSMVAAKKGSSAIAIGNVIGSNIFNIFFVMGICAAVEPMAVGNISYLDLGLMLASMLLLWGFSYTKRTIERWEGAFLVIIYIAYLGYLIYNV